MCGLFAIKWFLLSTPYYDILLDVFLLSYIHLNQSGLNEYVAKRETNEVGRGRI